MQNPIVCHSEEHSDEESHILPENKLETLGKAHKI
jgi:hypothetical protein